MALIDVKGKSVLVSDKDIDRIRAHTWWLARLGANNEEYAVTKIGGIRVPMHRYVAGCSPRDGNIVDHINGDTLDNRSENLRVGDATMNMRNRRINRNNSSGKSGVWFKQDHGPAGAWVATARIDGRTVSKKFGCLKRGTDAAFEMASSWRNNVEHKLGITVRS